MRESLLGQDSMSDGLQHSDGDKPRIGTWGVNHVKTNSWTFRTERYRRGDVLCFFHIGVGLWKILRLSNIAVHIYLGLLCACGF